MAPAVVSRLEEAEPEAPLRGRHSQVRNAMTVLAFAEMVADKVPAVGSRLETGPMVFRAISGALACAALAPRLGVRRSPSAVLGAISAVAGAYALATARNRITDIYRIPDPVIGIIEDGLALGLAALVSTTSLDRENRSGEGPRSQN